MVQLFPFVVTSASPRVPPRRGYPGRGGVVVVAMALAMAGCASHSDRTRAARSALDAGKNKAALAELNKAMDVASSKELPAKLEGDNILYTLDRAMILQATGEYELSSRDLEACDKAVEILDFSRSSLDDIGKYMFSDSAGGYKAPAFEKLMINTVNMVNYLARGDLSGARVEARRFAIMSSYIADHNDDADGLLGPGSYLAGFIFEKSGNAQEALRYYDEALQYADYDSLDEPIYRLSQLASYRSPRIRKVLDRYRKQAEGDAGGTASFPDAEVSAEPAPGSGEAPPTKEAAAGASSDAEKEAVAGASSESASDDRGEILVTVSLGRIPAKKAVRLPIGLALTYASGFISPTNRAQANRLAAQGLVTWVNYPELEDVHGSYASPRVRLGNSALDTELAAAIDDEVKKAWRQQRGVIVASAITRTITRLAVGEGVRQIGKAGDQELLGFILGLFTQAAMSAADTPDTRSWATLPAEMHVARIRVKPGKYKVRAGARGRYTRKTVTVRKRGWATVNLTVLR